MPNSDTGINDVNQRENGSEQQIRIFNMGDVSLDFHIMTNMDVRRNQKFQITTGSHTYIQNGGSWFTGKLIDRVEKKVKHLGINLIKKDIVPTITDANKKKVSNTFSFVANYQDKLKGEKQLVWRVFQYLGKTNQELEDFIKNKYKDINSDLVFTSNDLLVINEYNLHIKHDEDLWPKIFSLDDNHPNKLPIIYFRLSNPKVDENKLLQRTLALNTQKVIITTVRDLANHDIHIRQGLSWEIITSDLINAIEGGKLSHLKDANYLVVIINRSGVLFRDNNEATNKYTLYWQSKDIEDESQARDNGDMRGLNTGMLINIIYACLKFDFGRLNHDNIIKGIKVGLACMEDAYNKGFIENLDKPDKPEFEFPEQEIIASNEMFDDKYDQIISKCSCVTVPDTNELQNWSILTSLLKEENVDINNISKIVDIVISGIDNAFGNAVPYASFGDLIVTNAQEIKEYREIRRLIHSYMMKEEYIKPLSIAVLGEPGSGKSFGIKQIVNSFPVRKPEILYFNLSQFVDRKELINAFQKIRDEAIKGNIVLVIWDEFDCHFDETQFGWVKHFLAPMQDGKFSDGPESHDIGPAIFVFIGSQINSMEELVNNANQPNGTAEQKSSKLKDFISRLQGHLNIMGINSQNNALDIEVILHRAIILRSILLRHYGSIVKTINDNAVLSIEKELVEQLLQVPKYKYGVRSLESIILMSHMSGKSRFNRACLPTIEQLELHIDKNYLSPIVQMSLPI